MSTSHSTESAEAFTRLLVLSAVSTALQDGRLAREENDFIVNTLKKALPDAAHGAIADMLNKAKAALESDPSLLERTLENDKHLITDAMLEDIVGFALGVVVADGDVDRSETDVVAMILKAFNKSPEWFSGVMAKRAN